MSDVNIWRAMGAKALLEYISSAKGEQHDAVVYDTGYEFDASNPDAVRFVASVAMTKSSESGEDFLTEIPNDGSVVPRLNMPSSEVLLCSMQERMDREKVSSMVYVPDSDEYCRHVLDALKYRRIHIDDMTEEERIEFEKSLKRAKRSDQLYMVIHCYIPLAFAVITFFYLIFKFTQ